MSSFSNSFFRLLACEIVKLLCLISCLSRSDFRSRYPSFEKVVVKLVVGMISLMGKFPLVFYLWSFMRSYGMGIDFESIPSVRKSGNMFLST